jgi:hypothetical protein
MHRGLQFAASTARGFRRRTRRPCRHAAAACRSGRIAVVSNLTISTSSSGGAASGAGQFPRSGPAPWRSCACLSVVELPPLTLHFEPRGDRRPSFSAGNIEPGPCRNANAASAHLTLPRSHARFISEDSAMMVAALSRHEIRACLLSRENAAGAVSQAFRKMMARFAPTR